jgi:hypothetical protein
VETLNLPAADCSSVSGGGQLNQETTAKEGEHDTIGGIKEPLKSFGGTGTNKASSLREELARSFDRQERRCLLRTLSMSRVTVVIGCRPEYHAFWLNDVALQEAQLPSGV